LTVRLDAACPSCGSLERHRLLKLWVDGHESALRGRTALHFAPEMAVRRFVSHLASGYVTADLHPDGETDRILNIEQIDLPDHAFEVVICSHVLEHVDDRKALAELHRIVSPNGLLLLMVPIIDSWPSTYEDPTIRTERDRLLYYGQRDHVRFYGADFPQRVRDAGFEVETFTAQEPDVSRFGLLRGETLFICARA
jgi:SAM-dependent methyltransferase